MFATVLMCAGVAGLLFLFASVFWRCGAPRTNGQQLQDSRAALRSVGLQRIQRGAIWCARHGLQSARDAMQSVMARALGMAYKEDGCARELPPSPANKSTGPIHRTASPHSNSFLFTTKFGTSSVPVPNYQFIYGGIEICTPTCRRYYLLRAAPAYVWIHGMLHLPLL
jgi:hypothetical protein